MSATCARQLHRMLDLVRERAAVLKLLACEDQPLLVRRDALLIHLKVTVRTKICMMTTGIEFTTIICPCFVLEHRSTAWLLLTNQ